MSRFRYAYLLIALSLVVFVRPFISEQARGLAVVDVLLVLSLLAGAYAAATRKRSFLFIAMLGIISGSAQLVFLLWRGPATSVFFLSAGLVFYSCVAWAILVAIFADRGRISRDTLCQAVSVYLLLGLIWAMAYALLEQLAPNSFHFTGEKDDTEPDRFERFLGFSFTTLTTLGYGNVAPATPRADALATLQAVVGQFYLAVVIARLVAVSVAQRESPAPDTPASVSDRPENDA